MKQHRFLFCLLLLAIAVRLIVLITAHPWSSDWNARFISSDAGSYFAIANNLLNHGAYSVMSEPPLEPDCNRTPVFPFFLTAMFLVFGVHVGPVFVVQLLLSLMVVGLLYRIGQMFSSEAAARIAAVLAALDLYVVEFACMLWTEFLFVFWLTIILYLIGRLFKSTEGRSRPGWLLFFLGVVLGLAVLTRPVATYLLPLLVVAFLALRLFRVETFRFPLHQLLFLVLGWLLVVSPWLIRNRLAFDRIGISSISGYNMLYFDAAATLARAEDLPLVEAKSRLHERFVSSSEEATRLGPTCLGYASYLGRCGIRVMLEYPVDAVIVHLKGVFVTFRRVDGFISGQGIRGKWSGVPYYRIWKEEGLSGLIRAIANDPNPVNSAFFVAHLALLLTLYAGVILSLPWWRTLSRDSLWFYAILVVCAFYFVMLGSIVGGVRMRLPVHPIMQLLAGIGFATTWERLSPRRSGESGTSAEVHS